MQVWKSRLHDTWQGVGLVCDPIAQGKLSVLSEVRSLSLDSSSVNDRFDRNQSRFHRELFEFEGDGANERGTFPYLI
jgi:hypothetical protein